MVSGGGSDTLFYQTPSGLLLAPPSTSPVATLSPEGYVLSVPGTPAFALPPKVLPGHGELFVTDCLKICLETILSASYCISVPAFICIFSMRLVFLLIHFI